MKFFLLIINIVLNIWLIIASGISQIPEIDNNQIIAIAFSGLLLVSQSLLLKLNGKGLYILAISVSGLLIIASSAMVISSKWQIMISSVLILLILFITFKLRTTSKDFIIHAADGAVLMETKKIEFKNSRLVVHGKMMGAMPTIAHFYPVELWKALSMISFNVILSFPKLIYLGWKSAKKINN